MITLAIDSNNDLVLAPDGNVSVLTGAQAVAQNTKTAMQAQRGEMEYFVDNGMPLRATALDRLNLIQFEAAARATILDVPGVVSVNEFDAQNNDGTLTYNATITTSEGVINV